MPRIRTIKPDFWIDEKIARLKRDERLLFIGLWNLADDQGVVKSNSAYIKGQLFSYDDDVRITTVDQWLVSLTKALMLVPFTVSGEGYYIIRTFKEHQVINRPSKPKWDDVILSKITHGVLTEYSHQERKGSGTGNREGNGEPTDPFFESFRRASGSHITDEELKYEVGMFKNKYPNVHINQAGALINAWVKNIGKQPEQPKRMVH